MEAVRHWHRIPSTNKLVTGNKDFETIKGYIVNSDVKKGVIGNVYLN